MPKRIFHNNIAQQFTKREYSMMADIQRRWRNAPQKLFERFRNAYRVLCANNPSRKPPQSLAPLLMIGDTMQDGPAKGWIYCETTSRRSFYIAPQDSGAMNWYDATAFAARANIHLPMLQHLEAMDRARKKGMLDGAFNETDSDAIAYWSSAELVNYPYPPHYCPDVAHCWSFKTSSSFPTIKDRKLSTRYIMMLTP